MTDQLKTLYKDNVVVEILTVQSPHDSLVRKSRSLQATEETVSWLIIFK